MLGAPLLAHDSEAYRHRSGRASPSSSDTSKASVSFFSLSFHDAQMERHYTRFSLRRHGALFSTLLWFLIGIDVLGMLISVVLAFADSRGPADDYEWAGRDPTVVQEVGHWAFAAEHAACALGYAALRMLLRRESAKRRLTRLTCLKASLGQWNTLWEWACVAAFVTIGISREKIFSHWAEMGYVDRWDDENCAKTLQTLFQNGSCSTLRKGDNLHPGWFPNGRVEQGLWDGVTMMLQLVTFILLSSLRFPFVFLVAIVLVAIFMEHIVYELSGAALGTNCVFTFLFGSLMIIFSAWRYELYRRTLFWQEILIKRNNIRAEVLLAANPFSASSLRAWLGVHHNTEGDDDEAEQYDPRAPMADLDGDGDGGGGGGGRRHRRESSDLMSIGGDGHELPPMDLVRPSIHKSMAHVLTRPLALAGATAGTRAREPGPGSIEALDERNDDDDDDDEARAKAVRWSDAAQGGAFGAAAGKGKGRRFSRMRKSGSLRGRMVVGETEALGRWAIDFNKLQLLDKVAAGGNGQVFKARYGKKEVAVKQLFATMLGLDATNLAEFGREAHALAHAGAHPNITALLGVAKSSPQLGPGGETMLGAQTSLFLVTEWADGGNLKRLLQDPTQAPNGVATRRDVDAVLDLGRQIAAAMAHLHRAGIAHLDLKPPNCLLSRTARAPAGDDAGTTFPWRCLVCDFGLSRIFNTGGADGRSTPASSQMTVMQGTPLFMPPELAVMDVADMSKDKRTRISDWRKMDVYSFGILLAACCTQNQPFAKAGVTSNNPFVIMRKVLDGQLRPVVDVDRDNNDVCPVRLLKLMARCWDGNPDARPSFEDIEAELQRIVQEEKERGTTTTATTG